MRRLSRILLFLICTIFIIHAHSTPLNNGGKVSGAISVIGEIDIYTFSGDVGNRIFVSVADTSDSSFSPRVEVYAPDGSFVIAGQGNLVGSRSTSLLVSGNYTVNVRDSSPGNNSTGSYDIHFALIPGANEGGTLPNGFSVSEEIVLGDIDTWTFTANAGERVFLRAADTDTTESMISPFSPKVSLYGPSGSFLGTGQGNLVGNVFSGLPETGTYTAVITDSSPGSDSAGNYDLYIAKLPGANDGNGLSGGQTKFEFIDLGDLDSFAFSADIIGSAASFIVTDLDEGLLTPRITLFAPDGSFIVYRQGTLSAQLNVTLDLPGNYTLVVNDYSPNNNQIGNYSLEGVGNFTGVTTPNQTCNGLPVTVNIGAMESPTSGDDVILGTVNADLINALGGNDTICAGRGNDIVNAGNGDDWVDAGGGNDHITGGNGSDTVFGGGGKDNIFGGPGVDFLSGEENDDVIFGNSGNDFIDGGDGVDQIKGGSGNDNIETGPGATVGSGVIVDGGAGNDIITGGEDADEIRGAFDNDTINGGGGNDRLFGGGGFDVVNGQGGDDLIRGNAANDTLTGGSGMDNIDGGTGRDLIIGGADNDTLAGSTGNDEIHGESGNDIILGGGGNDLLFGDSGVDEIRGGGGNDALDGGGGAPDNCNGETGIDTATASCEAISNVP